MDEEIEFDFNASIFQGEVLKLFKKYKVCISYSEEENDIVLIPYNESKVISFVYIAHYYKGV